MTISKGISVVLTLDDSGFSQKTIKAKEATKSLEIGFTGLGKATESIENSISTLSKSVGSFSASFDGMQKSLDAVAKRMQSAAAKDFGALDKATKESAKVAKNAATDVIDAKIKTLDNEINTNKKMLESRKQTFQQMQAIAQQERQKSEEALNRAADAEKRLGAYGGKNVINQNVNEALRHEQNATAIDREVAAIDRWVNSYRTEQAARTASIIELQRERQAAIETAKAKETLSRIGQAVSNSNAKEMERVSKMAADRQRESDAAKKRSAEEFGRYKKALNEEEIRDARRLEAEKRAAINETMAAQKLAAREAAAAARAAAAEAKAQAKMVADMWKGMAQAYAGAKIGQGLKSSVNSASEYERQQYSVKTLNFSKSENDYIEKKSWEESKQLKFASATDQMKARLAMIGGLAENNVKMIDELMPTMAKAAFNIRTMTGDKTEGGYENMIRNLTGVIEARQQTNDPEAAKKTIELVQKIYAGTGRKIDIADIETFFRRDGTGADKITDEGLAKVVAFLDQAKVSGGHGTGGGGVSTVGTMVKMFQKMANGGTMTVEGAKQFAESGLMDMSEAFGKGGKQTMRELRHNGLDVAALSNADPVAALQQIAKSAFVFMERPENRKKYFGDKDVNDESARKDAMMRYAIKSGWSTNAASMLTTAGNDSAMKRADHSANQVMNGMTVDQAHAEAMKTYAANVEAFTASWENLKTVLGTSVLPIVTKVFNGITVMIDKMTAFGQENPIATTLTTITAGFGGVLLSINGFLSVFGSAGLLGTVKEFMNIAPSVAPALNGGVGAGVWGTMKGLIGGVAEVFAELASWCATLVLRIPVVGTAFLKIGEAIGFGGGMLKSFGAIFKGVAATMLAWDIGWMVGSWAREFKVGTLTIGEHFQNLILTVSNGWEKMWLSARETYAKFRNFMHIDSDAETKVRMDGIEAERKALEARARLMKITTSSKEEKPTAPEKETAPTKAEEEEKKRLKTKNDKTVKEIQDSQNAAAARMRQIEQESAGGNRREHTDPLVRALETTKGEVDSAKTKLAALYSNAKSLNTIRQEVVEELEGRRKGGDFDHDRKRKVGANDPKYKELVENEIERRTLTEQMKAVQFANERVAAAAVEADAAMERLSGDNTEKASDAFRALEKELARAEQRLNLGKDALEKWDAAKNKALANQSLADAANYAAELSDKTKKNNLDNIPSEQERARKIIDVENDKEQAKYNLLIQNLDKQQKAREDSLAVGIASIEEFEAEWEKVSKEYADRRTQIEEAHSAYLASKAIADARALRSPMEAMVEQWEDSTKTMQQAQTQWSESFVSMITSSMSSGKLEVGNFVKYVLQSILDAQLKAALARPLSSIMGGVGSFVSGMFGFSGGSGVEGTPGFMGPSQAPFAFANGGIMTNFGPVELRKYANGGIANSPQLALYGEAGPEAYVPLPDGRSIPVTLTMGASGGGQSSAPPAVTVNVINQTSQQASAQEGQMRFDGKQYILDVVLTAANSPGGFRNGLKEAVK